MNDALFDARLIRRLQTLSRLAAIVAIAVGCMVITGWLFNIERFMTIQPGLVSMKVNTALAFIGVGVALLSVRRYPRLTEFFAAFIILLGLLTLCEYAFGWNLGIDQLFIQDAITPPNNFPGRMSPVTTINFCLIGSSLLLSVRFRRFALAQLLTLVAGFTSLLALAGYIYGVQSLYRISVFSSIALHTTIIFLALCVAIFFIEPEQGFAGKILTNRAGGLLARRLIPAVIVISLLLGWLRLKGQDAGIYDTRFGEALLVMSTIVVFILLVFWTARSLNQVDARRAEEEAQRRQSDEAIVRYSLRLTMLHEIDKGILEARSIPSVIEVALKHVRQLIPCQRVDVMILDEATGEAVIFAVDAEGDTKLGEGVRVPVPPNVFEGYDARNIRVFEDIRLFQDTKPRAKQLVNEGLLSALSVLLMDRERPLGTLGLFANTPGFFTAEHEEIVVEVASQVSIAINQLRLSDELVRHAAEMERRVTELLEARVEERTSELNDMNEALQEVLTQRKHAEDQFRALLESAPDAMIITNPDGDIVLVNAQTEKFFGYTRAELNGLPIEMLIPECFHCLHPANTADAAQERSTGITLERYAVRKDGSQFPIEISISPIETEEGVLVTNAIRDVTERKLAEESVARLAAIVESSDDAIITESLDGTITSWNHGAERVFGYSATEMIGQPITVMFPPGREVEDREILERLIRGEIISNFDSERITKDGRNISVSITISPVRDVSGNMIGASKIIRDITKRKQEQQEAIRLQNALNRMIEGAQIIGFDWRYIYLNDAAVVQGNRNKDELIGRTMMEMYPGIEQLPLFAKMRRSMEQRVPEHIENQFIFPDNSTGWFDLSIQPIPEGIFILSTDITERKNVADALRENEEKLQTVFNVLPVGATVMSADRQIIQRNAALEKILDLSMDDLKMGKYASRKYIHPDGTPMLPSELPSDRAIREQQTISNVEIGIVKEDGNTIWTSVSAAPLPRNQGLVTVTVDITERKQAEEALKRRMEEEHEFQNYLKALHEIMIELMTINELDAFYKRAVELGRERLGFDRLGLLLYDAEHSLAIGTYGTDGEGNLVAEHHLRFDPGGLTGILMRALEKEERFALDEDAVLLDDHKPMSRGWNAAAVLWNGSEKLGWLATDNGVQNKPISKPLLNVLSLYALTLGTLLGQKRTQAAVQESERRLNLLAQNSPDIIYIIDLSLGEVLYLNRPGFLGYSQSEIQRPESLVSAVHPDDQARLLAHWGEGLVGGKLKHGMIEYRMLDKQGEWQWIQSREMIFSATPDGTPTQILVTLTVITGRKQAEQQAVELEHERDRVKMLSDFVTNMSHDFRTPLTIMSTNLYLVSKITDPEKQKNYLASSEQQILALTRLIDRQLTMVRLDSQTTVVFQPIDVNQIASNLGFIIGSEAKLKNITIVSSLCEGKLMVQGHPDDLSMAFAELGKNAVRYTPDNGTITIRTRRENNEAVIEVSDTGIGIAEGDLARIFQRLYRTDDSRSSLTGGTGLGLSIVKRVVELHLGRIEVESVIKEGSVFRVFLPLSE